MKAIIIAAGRGSRLKHYTAETPKCLLPIKGKPMIQYQIDAFRKAGITDISLIKGYQAEKINIPLTKTYLNPDYANNNILFSLMCAEKELDADVIISYADIIYASHIVKDVARLSGDFCVVVDEEWRKIYENRADNPPDGSEKVIIQKGHVVKIGKYITPEEAQGEFIGMMKLSRAGAQTFRSAFHEILEKGDSQPFQEAPTYKKAYLTDLLQELINRGQVVTPHIIRREWLEIDTVGDYENAEKNATFLSSSDEIRL